MATVKTGFAGMIRAGVGSAMRAVAPAPADLPPISEHARVRAIKEIREGAAVVPIGAIGTVVHVIKGGIGYDVEFISPLHTVISASRSELKTI